MLIMENEEYYSINTLAKRYDMSKDFWRKRISSGEVKAVKLGRSVRIPKEEVDKIVKVLRTENDIVEEILNGY